MSEKSAHTMQAGRVGRPHGLDGSFYVTQPRPRLLTLGSSVTVGAHTLAIIRRAGTDEHPIVGLEGVHDREAAGELRGLALTVPARAAPALAEGEWWAHELEGCQVLDGSRLVGTVSRLVELPSCEALEVQCAGGAGSLLVPMVKDAVRRIRAEERRIEIDLDFVADTLPASARAQRDRGGDGGD
jgi:16S rRNA processing protein RimM